VRGRNFTISSLLASIRATREVRDLAADSPPSFGSCTIPHSMDRFLETGMAAPDVTVQGADGPLALSSLWSERPLLLVFLRHYG
jgi:hypothetical protein